MFNITDGQQTAGIMSATPGKKITFDQWEQAHQSALTCLYLDFLKETKPYSNNITLRDFEWFLFGQAKLLLKS